MTITTLIVYYGHGHPQTFYQRRDYFKIIIRTHKIKMSHASQKVQGEGKLPISPPPLRGLANTCVPTIQKCQPTFRSLIKFRSNRRTIGRQWAFVRDGRRSMTVGPRDQIVSFARYTDNWRRNKVRCRKRVSRKA